MRINFTLKHAHPDDDDLGFRAPQPHTLKMRVIFEVNKHVVSEICQDNKKRVNIFLQCNNH